MQSGYHSNHENMDPDRSIFLPATILEAFSRFSMYSDPPYYHPKGVS